MKVSALAARIFGIQYAERLFKDMTDHPEDRGERFTFETFGRSAAELASVSLFLECSDWDTLYDSTKRAMEKITYDAALSRWEKLRTGGK